MITYMNELIFYLKYPMTLMTNRINYLPSFSFANNGCVNRYCFTFTYGQEILELKMNTFNLEKTESDTSQVDM